MKLVPKQEDFARIRRAVKLYRVTSVITGVMLLLLVVVMVLKYGFNGQLYLFTPEGFWAFQPLTPAGVAGDFQPQGFNLFSAILIAHGWFYVLYLVSDFMLWSPMRWGFSWFLLIAAGGVVPFMSFVVEHFVARKALRELAELEVAA